MLIKKIKRQLENTTVWQLHLEALSEQQRYKYDLRRTVHKLQATYINTNQKIKILSKANFLYPFKRTDQMPPDTLSLFDIPVSLLNSTITYFHWEFVRKLHCQIFIGCLNAFIGWKQYLAETSVPLTRYFLTTFWRYIVVLKAKPFINES